MRWEESVACVGEETAHSDRAGKSERKRKVRRYNFKRKKKIGLKERLLVKGWTYLAQNGEHFWEHVSTVTKLILPRPAQNFCTLATVNCLTF